MIDILTNSPDNVVAAAGQGVVTGHDYEQTLVPRIEQALNQFSEFAATMILERNSHAWKLALTGKISRSGSGILPDESASRL
jgi:hypothetical protein